MRKHGDGNKRTVPCFPCFQGGQSLCGIASGRSNVVFTCTYRFSFAEIRIASLTSSMCRAMAPLARQGHFINVETWGQKQKDRPLVLSQGLNELFSLECQQHPKSLSLFSKYCQCCIMQHFKLFRRNLVQQSPVLFIPFFQFFLS